jgi:hypothetical protein
VTIQFGHNDQKIAPPESMGANLTSMVKQIRMIGGEPVLVTSLTRRTFNVNGTVADTLGPWANGSCVLVSLRQAYFTKLVTQLKKRFLFLNNKILIY